jgi:hypothetical protein
MHEGQVANKFFLIRTGRVIPNGNGKGDLRIKQSVSEILGWSWLISPYRWHFTGWWFLTRAIALDGNAWNKCEKDPAFGYEMLKRNAQVMERRQKQRVCNC